MFPLDHKGELIRSKSTIPNVNDFRELFFRRASNALLDASANNVQVDENRVSFTGGLFRLVWSWNVLNQIGYGYVELHESEDSFKVTYYASFRQMFVVISVMVFLFFGVALFSDKGDELSVIGKLAILVFAWLWLFGGNWFVAMARFPTFVSSLLWANERI